MKKSMRGTQGAMPQNTRKTDTMATERAAHEACDNKPSRGKMHPTSGMKPMPMKKSDSDRQGGY